MDGVVEASIEDHAATIEREVVKMTMPDVISRCVEDETALHVGQGVYGDDEIDPQGALVVKVCALIDQRGAIGGLVGELHGITGHTGGVERENELPTDDVAQATGVRAIGAEERIAVNLSVGVEEGFPAVTLPVSGIDLV